MNDGLGCIVVACLGIFGLIIWAAVEMENEIEAERIAFYDQCNRDKKPYECDIIWRTYENSVRAKQSADIAAANAGAAAGMAATRR